MRLLPQDNFRELNADHLIKTLNRLQLRIKERFPTSGLSQVAATVGEVAGHAVVTAQTIKQPNWPLRIGLGLVALLALIVGIVTGIVELKDAQSPLGKAIDFLKVFQPALVWISAVGLFLWTLEARFKRRKAVKAAHELRALAHIIDMHQLTKDPERIGKPRDDKSTDGPMSAEAVEQYLHYCTELLAIISKIGQLYVQGFPDSTALAAVDQCENLATGLSQKIWQKIMIIERLRSDALACARQAAAPPTTQAPTTPVQATQAS